MGTETLSSKGCSSRNRLPSAQTSYCCWNESNSKLVWNSGFGTPRSRWRYPIPPTGNARGCGSLSRNLLASGQLDLCGTDHWAWSDGSGAHGSRSGHQRHLPLSVAPRCKTTAMRGFHPVNRYYVLVLESLRGLELEGALTEPLRKARAGHHGGYLRRRSLFAG